MSSRAPTSAQPMAELTARSRLLKAAAALFAEQGAAAVSMDQVRQRAGVSNGSLYHHFPTRQHLAHALYGDILGDYHRALLARLHRARSAEAGVKALVGAHIQWVLDAPVQARLLHELRRSGALSADEAPWSGPNAQAFAALGQWVADQVAGGAMRAMPMRVWSALVFAPAISLTPHWLERDPPEVPAAVRQALAEGAWRAVSPATDPNAST